MPKQIKFNLIVDNKPIRDMGDLSNNFNIDDVLTVYQNGLLKRWLLVRGLSEEVKQLDGLKGDDIAIARELSRILLGEECDKEAIAAAAYPFEFRRKESEKLKQLDIAKNKNDEIIRLYHSGYEELLNRMENQSKNYPFLKSAVNEIHKKYKELYNLDENRIYNRFISSYPFVILTFLANRNQEMNSIFQRPIADVWKDINIELLLDNKNETLSWYFDNLNKGTMQPKIEECKTAYERQKLIEAVSEAILIDDNQDGAVTGKVVPTRDLIGGQLPFKYIVFDELKLEFEAKMSSHFHVKKFFGETNDYWKDIEQKGKWMIIKMERGNLVRNAGRNGEELGVDDVNGKFTILEGIDYKSKSNEDKLIYMEV
jgi:hypothetical protein